MILEIKHLTKRFGDKKILDSLSLTIENPRLIALIAPNGSGKTTLMNIICKLETMDQGKILIEGKEGYGQEIFNTISYMQDNSVLYQELTGWDHIHLVQQTYSLKTKKMMRTLDYLDMVSYLPKKVKTYSLGMKQHLLFALAIISNPKLLILDEPINGLDPISVAKVRKILLRLHGQGTTVILSSHNLDQIEALTNDILFLKQGKIITGEKIHRKFCKEYRLVVDNQANFVPVIKKFGLEYKVINRNLVTVKLPYKKENSFFESCLTKGKVYDCQSSSASLNQIYYSLFGGSDDS
ncbi:ABC transporter ATP-binding protein [Enterococcus sp. LJL99]